MVDLYTCDDISKRYGVKIFTVYSWIKQKKLPALKIGKSYRFTAADIEAFEATRRTTQQTTSP